MGSNGEFPYLSTEEKIQLLIAARQILKCGKLLIVGAGCEGEILLKVKFEYFWFWYFCKIEGTEMTIYLCNKLAEENADAVLVHTPHFYKSLMTPDALIRHYQRVIFF